MRTRILWNNLKGNPLLAVTTWLFMTVSAFLFALTSFLFFGLLGSVDTLMEKAQTPDFLQMHAGEINEKELVRFAGEHEEVSGGQLQRACICRSMINQPDILFADEPTGALNQGAAQEVMREFIRLNQEGTTILMVTHDSRVAAKCGRILYLLDGSVQGELSLAGMTKEKEKEEKVGRWLAGMGW